jgi:hypothetical protein
LCGGLLAFVRTRRPANLIGALLSAAGLVFAYYHVFASAKGKG